ncbi:MAG: Lrp/AsnC family transcriptional regulator [Hyphomicrobiaceae bacterium]|nr:MAG: Lrp/AsnC family transcriptional regulator [Hyphomicrobiaceae bacterium]
MLDEIDRKIINALQAGFPVAERPYRDAARSIGIEETELLTRIGRLIADGKLTRFGPLYNVERMGGEYCLCAMAVPEADFERVAKIVNALSEVAHNYERAHALNMWFVVAAETGERVRDVVVGIEAATGLSVLKLPKLNEFYLGLRVAA